MWADVKKKKVEEALTTLYLGYKYQEAEMRVVQAAS